MSCAAVWRWALPLVGFCAATLSMTWPMVNLSALGSAHYGGDAELMIWTLAWDNHALLNGLPLFDANVFYPVAASLRFNDPLVGISLFTLPIYALTGNPVLGYNLVWLLSFPLGALAMYALVRRQGASGLGAFTAGLVYAFSFYAIHHAPGHLSLIWTWPLPLSLLMLDRWRERPTWPRATAWGVVVLLQVLASWYLAVVALVAQAIWLAWIAPGSPGRWAVRLRQLATAGALSALLLWPLVAPYRTLPRPSREEVVSLSADWQSYLVPPADTWVGRWWTGAIGPQPRWIWGERTLFLGWIALGFAAAGLAMGGRDSRRARTGCLALGTVGLLLSFGPALDSDWWPVSAYDALARLPGASGFRAPARFSLLVVLALGVLAGHGASALGRRFGRAGAAAVAFALPLMLGEWRLVEFPGGPPEPTTVPAIYRSPHVATARALVSLPDYRGTKEWFRGANYFYYSTAHWRPIVNGYGRSEPTEHVHTISHMNAFPGPNNAKTMRRLGVDLIVLHGARYTGGVDDLVREALETREYDLVEQIESDYLFRVRPLPPAAEPPPPR